MRLALFASLALLAGCAAAPPLPGLLPEPGSSPYAAMARPDDYIGREVLWGAMLVEVRNRATHTEIEALAFPLDARQQPRVEAADQGRFLLILPGYAEAADWPAGRFVTLHGRIAGLRPGSLRGEDYLWAEVEPRSVHLWPRDFRVGRRWSVGVGYVH
jgi:outer membrane lipoprotein